MTTGKVGQPRASTAYSTTSTARPTGNGDLNPYRNSFKSYHGGGLTSTHGSVTENSSDVLQIPTEDANNIVSNETVVIYQYGGSSTSSSSGSSSSSSTMQTTTTGVDWERERVRMEFYATYDVMTGVRIAGTLAGFFGLMVMLVMYKSRTNMLRALKDPNLAAVAAEMVQEEEDRELQEVFDTLEAAGIYPELETLPHRERRLLSLGNISAPPTLNYSPRFSSVGGGSCSLWDPPVRPYTNYSVSSRPLPFSSSPSSVNCGSSRREAFRNSRNSSSDRSQCVSFDMSESTVRQMGRRRSDARAWMGRRATFQSIQSDALRSRNKVFLSNTRQGRESNRIKLIRLYTTSSSREEDVEEVIEHGLLSEEEPTTVEVVAATPNVVARQQSTSTTSFIVSSVDYQDSDLRSVGSESVFSERYADTDEERECSSTDSDENGIEVARLKAGAYQKLEQKRATARIDDYTIATYEAPTTFSTARSPPTATAPPSASARPKSLHESRTFELHSLVPKSFSSTGAFGQNSRDMVHQLLRREEQQRKLNLGLPGSSTKWSKETLF